MTKRIETLTAEQAARLPEFRDKWMSIGLKTGRANRAAAEQALKDAYVGAGLAPPKLIVWAESPMGGLLTVKLLKDFFKKYPKNGELGDTVRDTVWDTVGDTVWATVWDTVRATVRATGLRDEWSELWSWGQHDAHWLGFYDYFREVCGLKVCEKLDPLSRLAQEAGWTWMYRDVAVICERPVEMRLVPNTRGDRQIPHCETGPWIRWSDGYEMYALNGVRVTKQVIDTKPDDFTKEMVLGEKNVDVRRELFRKIGIVNFINKIGGKTIHAWKDYELIEVDFQDGKRRRGLKMQNPSIDAVHFERVDDKCSTVQEALAWRNQLPNYVEPEVLT